MLIHLVRHAHTDSVGRVLAGRGSAVGLSDLGRAQAEGLARDLADLQNPAIFSSPQLRAWQTACAIAASRGTAPIEDAGLDEIDFGDWTGQTFEALAPRPDWQAWNRCRSQARCPGGETMLAAQARAITAMLALAAAHPDRDVILVSHADILKSILAHALGMPIDLMQRLTLAPASRSVLSIGPDGPRVEYVNLTQAPSTG